jgi:hypothetical protein
MIGSGRLMAVRSFSCPNRVPGELAEAVGVGGDSEVTG